MRGPISSASGAYACDLSELPSLETLEQIWSTLAAECDVGFCLSWPWIRTWLSCLPTNIPRRLLTIRAKDRVIGLAVLTKRGIRRHRILHSRTWALHTTAAPDLDCIFIEHNGILARKADQIDAWRAWASAFADPREDWDEIKLAGVSPEMLHVWRDGPYRIQEDMQLVSRYVDLRDVRRTHDNFVSGLGKNTRARVRYTQRSFEQKHGPVRVETPVDTEQALSFYRELKALHQRSWVARGHAGAFASPFFDTFHARLIRDSFPTGCIQLLRASAGARTIGLLYNFVHEGDVSMYQSGFDYSLIDAANKQSPGLLTHALAIQYNLEKGLRCYDFLAGDNQYKQVLATHAETMWWGRVQRDRLRFRAEDLARALWRRWRSTISPRRGAVPPISLRNAHRQSAFAQIGRCR